MNGSKYWSIISMAITALIGAATLSYAGSANGPANVPGAKIQRTNSAADSCLVASTFFGGSGYDSRQTVMARDSEGHLFIADWTGSPNLPIEHPCFDSTLGGPYDVFIAKFSADLDSLLGCTYLGGSGTEGDWPVIDLAIGPDDDVYITGKTSSADFPTTSGCLQRLSTGTIDVFVSRLSNDLSTLIASTYLGGGGEDRVTSLIVLADGSVVVAGATGSNDFPCTPGCYDETYGGNFDAFISRLSASLTTLLASTLVGGANMDHPEEVHPGPDNDLFIGGWTSSTAYPISVGAFQTVKKGQFNGFITRMPLDLTQITASTFFGGRQGWDFVYGLDFDTSGVYVTGHTGSVSEFPLTTGAYDASYNSSNGADVGDDVFISRLNSDLTTLMASTYLGGQGWDGGWKVHVADSFVMVCGSAGPADFPTTYRAFDTSYNGGAYKYAGDGFFSAFDRNLTRLINSTFLGGSMNDHAHDLVLTAEGDFVVAGGTGSGNFPVTSHAADTSFNGGSGDYGGDAYLLILPREYLIDTDGDGIADSADNCPGVINPSQTDGDGDGLGDACDNCTDTDGDGYGDLGFSGNTCAPDNCPQVVNPDQADANQDGIGDACCCVGSTGNVDCDPDNGADISDLTALIDNLYISFTPLCCPREANLDGSPDGNVDISDLTALIDYLYISFTLPSNCL